RRRGRKSSMTWAAVTLGLSSLALAAFPLVRPFFPFDPRTPAETLAGASRAVTSPRWLVAHYLALIGFVLLLCVLPALHARLSAAGARPSARRATLLSGTGIALILPTLGVELYVLPGIGRLFLEGNAAVAPLVGSIYLGDRKSTRLNSSHVAISYAVFCLKKKKSDISVFK